MKSFGLERKLKRTALEIHVEIVLRLRAGGCAATAVSPPRRVDRRHTHGRNWDVEILDAGCARCRDLLVRTVRHVGNEYDCRDFFRSPASHSLSGVRSET